MGVNSFEWCYRTLIVGHEGPILVIFILMVALIVFAAVRGWIRIGPPKRDGLVSNRRMERMSDETRKHLFTLDGGTKYVTRPEFKEHREACELTICKKIDAVRSDVKAIDARLSSVAAEKQLEQKELSSHMGRVSEFMEHVTSDIKDLRAAMIDLAKGIRDR